MHVLAIDTAGPNCAAAVARGTDRQFQILARSSERIGRGHAERLIPMVNETLAAAGLAYPDLDRVAVSVGPGSFTGVRVGVAAARGLALALGIEAVGVGTLDALAYAQCGEARRRPAVVALDARRGECYLGSYAPGPGFPPSEPLVMSLAEAAAFVAAYDEPVWLIGSAGPLILEALARPHSFAEVLWPEAHAADVAVVAELAGRSIALRPASPVYIRGPDAKPQAGKSVARASAA